MRETLGGKRIRNVNMNVNSDDEMVCDTVSFDISDFFLILLLLSDDVHMEIGYRE